MDPEPPRHRPGTSFHVEAHTHPHTRTHTHKETHTNPYRLDGEEVSVESVFAVAVSVDTPTPTTRVSAVSGARPSLRGVFFN